MERVVKESVENAARKTANCASRHIPAPLQPKGIRQTNRVLATVTIKIETSPQTNRILCGPGAGVGVVVTKAEADQVGVAILQAACETKGDGKCGVGVGEDVAEGVVSDFLDDRSSGVGDGADGADLVGDEVVGLAVLEHFGAFEADEEVVGAIVDGEEAGDTGPEVFFGDDAVDLLGDALAGSAVDVFDDGAVGEGDAVEFAVAGVVVGGGFLGGHAGSDVEEAVGIVAVGVVAGGEEPVVIICGGAVGDAAEGVEFVGAPALDVIGVVFDENTVAVGFGRKSW